MLPLPPLFRKVGRVNDRAGLEIRYTPFGYRGFESLTFRNVKSPQVEDVFCLRTFCICMQDVLLNILTEMFVASHYINNNPS